MISAAALAIVDEVLSHELRHFTDYLADPMMEGQEGLAVAQGEVDRLQPVLDEVRAARSSSWVWHSFCSAHQQQDLDCPRCRTGNWVKVVPGHD